MRGARPQICCTLRPRPIATSLTLTMAVPCAAATVGGLRLAALELHDVGVDAALGEEAQRLGDVGRGVHHVRRRHRHADVDLAHRRAVRCGLGAGSGRGECPRQNQHGGGRASHRHGRFSPLDFVPGLERTRPRLSCLKPSPEAVAAVRNLNDSSYQQRLTLIDRRHPEVAASGPRRMNVRIRGTLLAVALQGRLRRPPQGDGDESEFVALGIRCRSMRSTRSRRRTPRMPPCTGHRG